MNNQLTIALDATNELQILLETESIDNSMKIAKISRLNTIALKAIEFVLFVNSNNINSNNNNNNNNNNIKNNQRVCKYWQASCCKNKECAFWHPSNSEMEYFNIKKNHCPYGINCKDFGNVCNCANKINGLECGWKKEETKELDKKEAVLDEKKEEIKESEMREEMLDCGKIWNIPHGKEISNKKHWDFLCNKYGRVCIEWINKGFCDRKWCKFAHPKICKYGNNCKKGKECIYVHLESCKNENKNEAKVGFESINNNEIVGSEKKKENETGIFKNKKDIWKKCESGSKTSKCKDNQENIMDAVYDKGENNEIINENKDEKEKESLKKKRKKKRKRKKKNETESENIETESENEKKSNIENKSIMEAVYDKDGRIIQVKRNGIGLIVNRRRKSSLHDMCKDKMFEIESESEFDNEDESENETNKGKSGLNNILNNRENEKLKVEKREKKENKNRNNEKESEFRNENKVMNKKKSKKERYIASRMHCHENDFGFEDEIGNENLILYDLEKRGYFDKYENENDYENDTEVIFY